MNTTPTAKEIGHLWFEHVWNLRDRAKLHELMAPDAVGYLEGGQEIVGPDAFAAFQSAFLEAIPDIHIEVVDSLADEDDVCVHWTAKGTHTGPGLGMAATGQEVSFRGVTWLHTKNGQVVGGRDFWNQDGLMRTLSNAVVS
ncbi:MAG: ester cyclase [Luteolibacter sp.]|uniref:ester cyclase n=1 Tax=Luteolibacter sp. TaxID=1962973 RepID=UPI00326407E3